MNIQPVLDTLREKVDQLIGDRNLLHAHIHERTEAFLKINRDEWQAFVNGDNGEGEDRPESAEEREAPKGEDVQEGDAPIPLGFFHRDGRLVRRGPSSKEQGFYEHAIPKEAILAVAETVAAKFPGGDYSLPKVQAAMPGFPKTKSSVAVGWFRTLDLPAPHHDFKERILAAWEELPDESEMAVSEENTAPKRSRRSPLRKLRRPAGMVRGESRFYRHGDILLRWRCGSSGPYHENATKEFMLEVASFLEDTYGTGTSYTISSLTEEMANKSHFHQVRVSFEWFQKLGLLERGEARRRKLAVPEIVPTIHRAWEQLPPAK
jgi:hypothetical protein